MASENDTLTGDPSLYSIIAIILTVSFFINGVLLLMLNFTSVIEYLDEVMGQRRSFFVQLFFWGTTGATIAGSACMAKDKDMNELERKKGKPDPIQLRYPNKIDVWLYIQRILSSGFLSLFGTAILFAGLGYFDVSIEQITSKHKMLLVVFCFLIGLYENKFLGSIEKLSTNVFKKHATK